MFELSKRYVNRYFMQLGLTFCAFEARQDESLEIVNVPST